MCLAAYVIELGAMTIPTGDQHCRLIYISLSSISDIGHQKNTSRVRLSLVKTNENGGVSIESHTQFNAVAGQQMGTRGHSIHIATGQPPMNASGGRVHPEKIVYKSTNLAFVPGVHGCFSPETSMEMSTTCRFSPSSRFGGCVLVHLCKQRVLRACQLAIECGTVSPDLVALVNQPKCSSIVAKHAASHLYGRDVEFVLC